MRTAQLARYGQAAVRCFDGVAGCSVCLPATNVCKCACTLLRVTLTQQMWQCASFLSLEALCSPRRILGRAQSMQLADEPGQPRPLARDSGDAT